MKRLVQKFQGGGVNDYGNDSAGTFANIVGNTSRTVPYLARFFNYYTQMQYADKIEEAKSQYKSLESPTQQHYVRPVQDMPSEVLAARQLDINRIRSEYAGADSTMIDISNRAADSTRMQERAKLGAERASYVAKDMEREAADINKRSELTQIAAVDNVNRRQSEDNIRLQARIEGEEKRELAINTGVSDFIQHMDTLAATGAAKYDMITKGQLDIKKNSLSILMGKLAIEEDPVQQKYLEDRIKEVNEQINQLLSRTLSVGDAYYTMWTGKRPPVLGQSTEK